MRVDKRTEVSSQSPVVTEPQAPVCANPGCGKPVTAADKSRGGRPTLYCGQACRQAVYRAKRQPTAKDLRYDALGLYRRLEVPRYMGEALERVPGDQLPDLISFLRTATAALAAVRSLPRPAAGPPPGGQPTRPLVDPTAPA